MKRSNKFKVASIFLLGAVLIGFNQCIVPSANNNAGNLKFNDSTKANSKTSNGVSVSKTVSVEAFNSTVYPITRAHCLSCHGTTQTPLHAASDVGVAYDAVINASKVDLNNPSNSRLVLKLRNEHHNCWGTCAANADEMEAAIVQWKNKISGSSSSGGTTVSYGKTTPQTISIDQSLNPDSSYDENSVHLMGESASLKAPMTIGKDGDVSYIYVNTNSVAKDLNAIEYGAGYLNFMTNTSDFYHVYMLVNAPVESTSGVYVKVAGSDYKDWTIGATKGFEWRELTNTPQKLDTDFYIVGSKSNVIEIRQKFSGIKIAKIVITNDVSYNPTATPKALSKATLSVSLKNLLNGVDAQLMIDIEDFDMYSYKVSNPRIVSTSKLKIKKLKVLVNNSFNSQHATYLNLDMTTDVGTTVLSNASMILLKDKGNVDDKLSFAFDIIEVVK